MTPNWDDPAVPAGSNPELSSDRYSIALIFLRVVGAANFPVQARQRQGGTVSIDFPIPPGYAREVLLGPGSLLWDLCARGLSTEAPAMRPAPSDWVAALETVLDGLGAAQVMRSVWMSQGGGPVRTATPSIGVHDGLPADVSVRPVIATSRVPPPKRIAPARQSHDRPDPPWRIGGTVPTASVHAPGTATGVPVHRQIAAGAAIASRWWLDAHRSLFASLSARSGTRVGRDVAAETLRRLALCAAVDLAVALLGLFLVAMAVAPILGL